MLPDNLKILMFDEMQETAEQLREENSALIAELDRCNKRFDAMAWSLECLVRIAKDLPEPTQEQEPAKKRRKK